MGLKQLRDDIEMIHAKEKLHGLRTVPAILDITRLLIDEHLAYMNTESFGGDRRLTRVHTIKAMNVTEAIKGYGEP